MRISISEISKIFDNLINEVDSRESISEWAFERMDAHDNNDLEFENRIDKNRIMRALSYLCGVDLLDMDGTYLHSTENFIDFRNEHKI